MSKKYNFNSQSSKNTPNNVTSFYQICQYPVDGMIWVRKLLVDDLGYMTQKIKIKKDKCFFDSCTC
jgi:hypothetical protein